jgi:AAA+ superfamily predicted ATPase
VSRDTHSPAGTLLTAPPPQSRYDSNSGGEREIQRTLLELLNQLDGFDTKHDVKVIMATNKIESLDPALIRPGRIDRKIEFPLPDQSECTLGIYPRALTTDASSSVVRNQDAHLQTAYKQDEPGRRREPRRVRGYEGRLERYVEESEEGVPQACC